MGTDGTRLSPVVERVRDGRRVVEETLASGWERSAPLRSRLHPVWVRVRGRTERARVRRRILCLCVPFLSLAAFAGFYPLWKLFRMSLSKARFATEGITVSAYRTIGASMLAFVKDLLGMPTATTTVYGEIAFNTLWFSLATTLASLAVAIAIAHGLEKYDLPYEGALVTLLSFPISLPGIVAAFMVIVLAGNKGLLTNVMVFLTGAAPGLAAADPTSLAVATTVVGLFFGYLYSMIPRALLILRGTYAEINTDAEEAARALGATPWQTFRYATLPQIKPGVIGAFVLTFRTALAIFGTLLIIQSLTLWTKQINRELLNGYQMPTASALAIIWFGFVFAFTFLTLRYTSAEVGI